MKYLQILEQLNGVKVRRMDIELLHIFLRRSRIIHYEL